MRLRGHSMGVGLTVFALTHLALAQTVPEQVSFIAVVQMHVPGGAHLQALSSTSVAVDFGDVGLVRLTLFPSLDAAGCAQSPGVAPPPWAAETVVHRIARHTSEYITCTVIGDSVLTVYAQYQSPAPEHTPPPEVVSLVTATIADLKPEADAPPAEADALAEPSQDLCQLDPANCPPPEDACQADPASCPEPVLFEVDDFLLAQGGFSFIQYRSGRKRTSTFGVAGRISGLVPNSNFGPDLGGLWNFDGRYLGEDEDGLLGHSFDIRGGGMAGFHRAAGALVLAGGIGGDAVSAPKFAEQVHVPPAFYGYTSMLVDLAFGRCVRGTVEGRFKLRSNHSNAWLAGGQVAVGCTVEQQHATGRFALGFTLHSYFGAALSGYQGVLLYQLSSR
jgi:hypothetical protein